MNTSIFLVGGDNKLTELRRTDYGSEDVFQKLLADHPGMLGAAAGPTGKLLLVRREQPVPDQAEGAERWSLDHLFIDGNGVPVLVEVKQASDTRARREVIAQMLDYAANGVAYWSIGKIIDGYRETVLALGGDPDSHLAAFLNGADAENFWRQVESNLRSGRVRMLFVADRIPKELARIVEFLNEQMRPAVVLAMEIDHFLSSSGMRTLVPRLVGATLRADAAKSVEPPTESLTDEEWLATLEEKFGGNSRKAADRLIEWFRNNGFEVRQSNSGDSLVAQLVRGDGKLSYPFFIRRSSGRLETSLSNLVYVPAFSQDAARKQLLDRIRSWPTTSLRVSDKLTGWPSVLLDELLKEDLWKAFCSVALEVKSKVQSV
jgi:hypothetical protein